MSEVSFQSVRSLRPKTPRTPGAPASKRFGAAKVRGASYTVRCTDTTQAFAAVAQTFSMRNLEQGAADAKAMAGRAGRKLKEKMSIKTLKRQV